MQAGREMGKLKIGDKIKCNSENYQDVNNGDIMEVKGIINKPKIQYYAFKRNNLKREVCFLIKDIDDNLFNFSVLGVTADVQKEP
jgi:hypothetical protein